MVSGNQKIVETWVVRVGLSSEEEKAARKGSRGRQAQGPEA